MSVKARLYGFVAVLVMCGLLMAVPGYVTSKVPAADYVRPKYKAHIASVKCNGTIEMDNIREIYLQTAVVPSVVWVSRGDYVEKGQVLVTIDQEQTKTMLATYGQRGIVNNSSSQTASSLPAEYEEIARRFGITPTQLEDALGNTETPILTEENEASDITIPTEIVAPMSGIVTDITLKNDQLSNIYRPAVTIGDAQNYIAVMQVRESDISLVKVGDTAHITGSGMGDRKYTGYVKRIDPVAKKQVSGTSVETMIEVEIAITDPDSLLKPGFSAKADIYTGDGKTVMMIPYECVRQDADNTEYVYVYQDQQVVRKNIKTGAELLQGVEVLEGLSLDDIVLYGQADYQSGGIVSLKRLVSLDD